MVAPSWWRHLCPIDQLRAVVGGVGNGHRDQHGVRRDNPDHPGERSDAEREDRAARVAAAPGSAMACSSPTAIQISAVTIGVSVTPHRHDPPAGTPDVAKSSWRIAAACITCTARGMLRSSRRVVTVVGGDHFAEGANSERIFEAAAEWWGFTFSVGTVVTGTSEGDALRVTGYVRMRGSHVLAFAYQSVNTLLLQLPPASAASRQERNAAMTKALPLTGIKVLDMTHVQAGPACCQQLAWMGADVLKVERTTGGDVTRNQLRDIADVDALHFTILNSNKRSIAIDTKTPRALR
jgi:CoA-transferase family III